MPSQIEFDSIAVRLDKFKKIVVTGSTGWLGKEAISLLKHSLGAKFAERVTCVSGSKGTSRSTLKDSTITWHEFTQLTSVDLLIHLAFLNQEKSLDMGLAKYIATNQKITDDVSFFLTNNPGCYVLNASSGAAEFYSSNLESLNPMSVYSALKLQAEEQYLANPHLASLINMRIWNITGENVSPNSPFLIVDLIRQVKETGKIHIIGNSQSTRMYVDAQEMLLVFLYSLEKDSRSTIDSGGVLTTFENLAKEILICAGISTNELFLNGEDVPLSAYVPQSNAFKKLANNHGVSISTLSQQVEKVFRVVF